MKPQEFIYLMSSHSYQQHVDAVKRASMVRMTTDSYLSGLRAVNPACRFLRYVNIAHTLNNIGATVARANGWICKDSSGNELAHKSYPTEFVLDLHIPACRQAVAAHCKSWITSGYDGIFGDYLGKPFSYNKNHYDSLVYHADGSLYTDSQMSQDMIALINEMRAQGCGILVGNGIPQATHSYGYYDDSYKALSDPISQLLDYVMIEGSFGWDASEAATRTVTDWLKTIQMYGELPSRNLYYCKPIGSTPEKALFAYCSYYMAGVNPDEPVHYSSVSTYQMSAFWVDLMQFDPGTPMGGMTQVAGTNVYRREYTGAVMYVNASNTTSYTVEGTVMAPQTGLLIEKTVDAVTLTYQSIPQGVPADVDGVPIQDGASLDVPRGSQVKLKVPLRIDI